MNNGSHLNRRQFLARAGLMGAATAVTGPLILPGRVRGEAPASDRVAVAMIGMGRQALFSNLKPFLFSPHARVVAVCDVDRRRLERAREEVDRHYASVAPSGTARGCATCRDFREILARPDIDAVMISTPDHWHIPMAIAAARAGKDVCLEKPISRSIAEGRQLVEAVERHGRIFRTDTEIRSAWFFHRLCELVRSGRIGRLRKISTGTPRENVRPLAAAPATPPADLDYDLWLGPAPAMPYQEDRVHPPDGYGRPGWMQIRDYCDGMITNWGTHLNDIAQWGHGTERTGPVEVEARGTYPKDGGLRDVLVGFDVRYRFADGVEMTYTMDRPFVRFDGDEGWISVEWSEGRLRAEPESLLREKIGAGDVHLPMVGEKEDFIECCRTRRRPVIDAEAGHRTTSLCLLGDIAIRLGGRRLKWDPDREVFPDDPAANALLSRPPDRPPWTLEG